MESDTSNSDEIKLTKLSRENQLLKIKLSKKEKIIEEMKLEQIEQIDALEEKLNDAIHKNKMIELNNEDILQNYFNNQEATLRDLLSKNLTLSQQDYKSLKSKQNLTIRELLAVKIYQMTTEKKPNSSNSNEVAFLRTKLQEANDVNEESLKDIEKLKKYIIELREPRGDENMYKQYMDLLNEKEGLFDVKTELEENFQRELTARGIVEKERNNLRWEVGECRIKIDHLNEKLTESESTIETLKLEKQQLWRNLLENRETARKNYQEKLERQLADNRNCLQNDLMKVKEDQKAVYDGEINHLRNQLQKMETERDKSTQLYHSTLTKYENLLSNGNVERRNMEESCQESAARAIFMKSEIERLKLFCEELQKRNKEYQLENEKKEEKLFLYMNELDSSSRSWEEKIAAVRREVEEEKKKDLHNVESVKNVCLLCDSLRDENKLLKIDLSQLLRDNKELTHLKDIVAQMTDEIPVKM